MYISRGIFQVLSYIIFGAIVWIWFFVEESERTIPIVFLVLLFIALSFEYLRQGYSIKKSGPG